jgi:four helix bundle protein
MLSFERLMVWKKAIGYAKELVEVADELPKRYQYSFADQLRRAALSVPSNIAEGAGRKGRRDSANFYAIARGSVYETVNILKLLEMLRIEVGVQRDFNDLYSRAEEIVKMLYGLSK